MSGPTDCWPVLGQDKASQEECAAKLQGELQWLEGQADSAGPYMMGTHFSLVDAAMLPWFLRLPILRHYRAFQWDLNQAPRLARWQAAAAQRPSVQVRPALPSCARVCAGCGWLVWCTGVLREWAILELPAVVGVLVVLDALAGPGLLSRCADTAVLLLIGHHAPS